MSRRARRLVGWGGGLVLICFGGRGKGKVGMYRSVIDSEGGPEEMRSSSESSESGSGGVGMSARYLSPAVYLGLYISEQKTPMKTYTYPCQRSRRNHSRRRPDRVVPDRAPHPRLLRVAPCLSIIAAIGFPHYFRGVRRYVKVRLCWSSVFLGSCLRSFGRTFFGRLKRHGIS